MSSSYASPSVLLAFRGENVRSFRDPFELSLLATRLSRAEVVRDVPWRLNGRPEKVLPAVGIFGANASGKSNLLRGIADMRDHVLHSFRTGSPTGEIPRRPFLLDPEHVRRPSRYEVDIILNGVRHTYGFSLGDEEVGHEWAVSYPEGREQRIFDRRGDHILFGRGEKAAGRAVQALLRPNALFLSTAAFTNHKRLLPLFSWFERNLQLMDESSRPMRQVLTAEYLDPSSEWSNIIMELLLAADLGITGARKQEVDPSTRERLVKAMRVLAGAEPDSEGDRPTFQISQVVKIAHRGRRGDIELDPSDESLGTQVWFGLVGPIVQALATGRVLLADELDASLHPALTVRLVDLFQDPIKNPHRAQLVFNSHDMSLLDSYDPAFGLGRDQIWFTEKGQYGESHLYALTDFSPRKQEAIGRRYMEGRYGALPIISPLGGWRGEQLSFGEEGEPFEP